MTKEYYRKYYQEHKEKILESQKKWNKKDRLQNKEKYLEKSKTYYANNKEYFKIKHDEYSKTPMGRASYLLQAYKREDRKRNRGEVDFDAKWIVENIFSKPCAHCGKEGWKVIGCNRLDNSKPHTKDNVEPCCFDCNNKQGRLKNKIYQYTTNNELVKIWESYKELENNGYYIHNISKCCNGRRKTHKGYKWSYEPL